MIQNIHKDLVKKYLDMNRIAVMLHSAAVFIVIYIICIFTTRTSLNMIKCFTYIRTFLLLVFNFYHNLHLSSVYFGTKAHVYKNITIEKHCFSENKISFKKKKFVRTFKV